MSLEITSIGFSHCQARISGRFDRHFGRSYEERVTEEDGAIGNQAGGTVGHMDQGGLFWSEGFVGECRDGFR